MSTPVLMPALSPTMEEGNLAKWHVAPGDRVSSGDVMAEIETDKAIMELEAVDEGVVARIVTPEGTSGVKVNSVIAVLAEEGEDVSAVGADGDMDAAPVEPSVAADVPTVADVAVAEQEPVRDSEIAEGVEYVSMTVRDALCEAMAEEMRRDGDVFVMGEEVAEYQGAYKVTRGLLEEFGERRVIDTPITEHGFAGVGVGAAFGGLRPIVEFMTFNFAMQALDQIVNSAAKTRYMSGGKVSCPIVFRGPNGAASRVAAQHSQDYGSWYGHVPGLLVIAPYDSADAKGLLKAAIRNENPVVFLEHELLYGTNFDVPLLEDFVLPIGRAKIRRQGTDVSLVAHSRMVGFALEAASELINQGIDAEVIDLRCLRPLDTDTVLESVKKTGRLVTCEEGWGRFGVGAELAAFVAEHGFDWLDAPPLRVHQQDVPLPYAANLEALSLPDAQDIIKAARQVCD